MKHTHFRIPVLLIVALLVALSLFAKSVIAGAPPTQISYQGLVKVSDVPFDGTGYFRFAIVNSATGDGTTYWLTGPEALTVSNGLFDFMLGSTTAPRPHSVGSASDACAALISENLACNGSKMTCHAVR